MAEQKQILKNCFFFFYFSIAFPKPHDKKGYKKLTVELYLKREGLRTAEWIHPNGIIRTTLE